MEDLSLIISFKDLICDSVDEGENTVDEEICNDENWDDEGPDNDHLEKSSPSEEIDFPDDN